ncbi:S1 RNA-binding domain-containing protein [Rossellomorea marisflavi]|uniref:S1 RNA-binding domain-containing protein n=1 Tax=Rossellomorea marisflavi TaxID=189381 RepID=UPI003FA0FAF7
MENQTTVETLEKYKGFMEQGKELTATIRKTLKDDAVGEDILVLDFEGVYAYVPRSEFDIRNIQTSFVPLVGRKIRVLVKEITEDGTLVCSRKLILENKRHELIQRMANGESVEAKITKFVKYGAYVAVDGVSLLLQNQNFSEDFTSISEVKAVGDKIEVKLHKVSTNGNLFAEATEKYKSDTEVNIGEFERDQVVIGKIRNIKGFGVFVCIAPNLDALCPVPETQEISEDMKVQFRITKVDVENGKVRGKILRVLQEEQEEEIL